MSNSNKWMKLDPKDRAIIEKYQKEIPMKLGALAHELGLIVKKSTLPANISGEIKEVDGVVTIRINRHDALNRQRYTLAHEISHFLLHRHLLQAGIQDDVLYRSSLSNVIETEANKLAADILMPLNLIKELLVKHSKGTNKESMYEAVAEEMQVSVTALKIRLEKI